MNVLREACFQRACFRGRPAAAHAPPPASDFCRVLNPVAARGDASRSVIARQPGLRRISALRRGLGANSGFMRVAASSRHIRDRESALHREATP
jgi:hypothetical protein